MPARLRYEPSGFGKLGGGPFGLAFEGIGRSEESVRAWKSRIGAARLFEPEDRLIDPRLQQVRFASAEVPICNPGIAWAEAVACSCAGIASSIGPM
jgi:hypothetical protein